MARGEKGGAGGEGGVVCRLRNEFCVSSSWFGGVDGMTVWKEVSLQRVGVVGDSDLLLAGT